MPPKDAPILSMHNKSPTDLEQLQAMQHRSSAGLSRIDFKPDFHLPHCAEPTHCKKLTCNFYAVNANMHLSKYATHARKLRKNQNARIEAVSISYTQVPANGNEMCVALDGNHGLVCSEE